MERLQEQAWGYVPDKFHLILKHYIIFEPEAKLFIFPDSYPDLFMYPKL